MTGKRQSSIEAALIRAVLASERRGASRRSIARAAGLAASQLTRLVNGERTLTLPNAEALARAVGGRIILQKGPE